MTNYTQDDVDIIILIRSRLMIELGDAWYVGEITSAKLSKWYGEHMNVHRAKLWLDKFPSIFRCTGREPASQRLNYYGGPCSTYSIMKKNIEAFFLNQGIIAAKAALERANGRSAATEQSF